MKRFDIAMQAIQDELYRRAGKAAVSYSKNKNVPIELAAETMVVKNLQEAIDILKSHERNKFV